ncbi:hypothetical protein BKA65DRAFT_534074 [Rhexocercosporidium sp. MPI-PUGE-AT-0058]|nr:hypothetical protein BKA65DRAFT_534074 [Rhexocercosporidium sp. MPI-PUGE-AT-0058]
MRPAPTVTNPTSFGSNFPVEMQRCLCRTPIFSYLSLLLIDSLTVLLSPASFATMPGFHEDEDEVRLSHDLGSSKSRTLYICVSIELLTSLGTSISSVPSIRLIESAICQRTLFTTTWPPEDLCKTTAIQSQMAHLLGAMSSFARLPTLVLTLPFSILSEHVDRRGYYPYTDLKLIWLSGLFDIIGGGGSVAQIILRSMISESIQSSTLRIVFYRLSGLNLLLQLFGISFGSWLLQYGAASTILVGLFIHGLTIPILTFLPRSCVPRRNFKGSEYKLCDLMESHAEPDHLRKASHPPFSISRKFISAFFGSLKSFKNLLLHNHAFVSCLAVMFLSTVSLSSSFGHIGTICLGFAEKRWQFVVAAVVISSSVGLFNALRAFFTAKVLESGGKNGAKDVQRLYGAMEVVQYLGIIGAAPIWSAVYSLGYRIGGLGMGLPFFGSAVLMGLLLLLVWQSHSNKRFRPIMFCLSRSP